MQTWEEVRNKHVPLLGDMRDEAMGIGKAIDQKLDVMNARLLVMIDLLQEIADNTKPREITVSGGGSDGGAGGKK